MYEIRSPRGILRFKNSDALTVLQKLEDLRGSDWQVLLNGTEITRSTLESTALNLPVTSEDLIDPASEGSISEYGFKVFK